MYRLDSWIRKFDRVLNSTDSDTLEKSSSAPVLFLVAQYLFRRVERWFPVLKGHSLSGMLSFLVLIPFLVLGPSFSSFRVSQPSAYVTLVLAYVGFFFLLWLATGCLTLFWVQFTTLATIFCLLFVVPVLKETELISFQLQTSEIHGGLYPHLLQPFAMIMAGVAMVAGIGASIALARGREEFPKDQMPELLLQRTELFEDPDKEVPLPKLHVLMLALFMVPLRFPVELLLLPSFYVVAASNGGTRDYIFIPILLFGSWLLIALGEIFERLRLGRRLMQRLFSYGGLWLTSVVIIGLAGAWLLDVSYVTTVMTSSSLLVVQYLIASFCLFWWMEYWLNRALSQRLLGLFSPTNKKPVTIPYAYTPAADLTPESIPKVVSEGRTLRLHGAGRFITIGKQKPDEKETSEGEYCWNFIDRTDLFAALAESASPKNREHVRKATKVIKQRIKTYFVLLNAGLVIVLLACGYYVETRDFKAVVTAEESESPSGIAPDMLLFPRAFGTAATPASVPMSPTGSIERPRVILVAASGGGTRAALYATSLLHGLSRIDALDDVRIVSGVSGGGLSMAWFASRYKRLLADDFVARSEAWDDYYRAMEYPYIVDVLHGGAESRIAQGVPLGQLLAESFGEQLYSKADDIGWRFNDVPESLGLILNTTLCGQFPPQHGDSKRTGAVNRFDAANSSGLFAGSRLIFTNLACRSAFDRVDQDSDTADKCMQYVVIDDGSVRLASAAALNANFPPVFPNAPVDLVRPSKDVHRFWVTDGGAQENRGVLSLLHVLKESVSHLQAKKPVDPKSLPDIHIIVAEASADSVAYSADRGVGAATVAKDQLAIVWAKSLLTQINAAYQNMQGDAKDAARIKMTMLPMPSCLRCGGIGTHWMLPKTVQVKATEVPGLESDTPVELSQKTVMQLIRDLHLPEGVEPSVEHTESNDAIQTVRKWIDNDPLFNHPAKWHELRESLKKSK